MAIITNGTVECQQGKVEALGLDTIVDVIVISEREGYRKPAPELFWLTCDKLKESPQNCLMIGDSIKADVEGALNAQLAAAFLQRDLQNASTVKAPTINSLSQIVSLLDSIQQLT